MNKKEIEEFKKQVNADHSGSKKSTTGPNSKAYKDGYDAIFGKKETQFIAPTDMSNHSQGDIELALEVIKKMNDEEDASKALKAMQDNMNNSLFQIMPSLPHWPVEVPSLGFDFFDPLASLTFGPTVHAKTPYYNDRLPCGHIVPMSEGERVQVGDMAFNARFQVCWECEDIKHEASLRRTQ